MEKHTLEDAPTIYASLERKPISLVGEPLKPTLRVDLTSEEFAAFTNRPMATRDWLAGPDTIVLVTAPNGSQVIVDTQGADYARYAARIR